MKYSSRQARAARALLGMDLAHVTAGSGVTASQISRYERDEVDLRGRSKDRLFAFYEAQGVEFTDGHGVRESAIRVRSYSGDEEFRLFYDHLYDVIRQKGGDVCLFNGVPTKIVEHLGAEWYAQHAQRMTAIRDQYRFRVIIAEGDTNFIGDRFVQYKWFPNALFNEKTLYIYGDCVAFFSFDNKKIRVLVVEHPEVANSQRVLFDLAWGLKATEIPRDARVQKIPFGDLPI